MKMLRRIVLLLIVALGAVGLLVCLAAVAGVWTVESRVERATQQLFTHVDNSLTGVRGRLTEVSQRVTSATNSTREIQQKFKQWNAAEVRQRAADRFGLEEKADRLSETLQQAERWLEASESSLEVAGEALQLAQGLGLRVRLEGVETAAEEVQALRGRFQELRQSARALRGADAVEERRAALEEQRQQGLRLALRVAATLASFDEQLAELDTRIAAAQGQVPKLKQQTLDWIRLAAAALAAVLGWMALGQAALCCLGARPLGRLRHAPS